MKNKQDYQDQLNQAQTKIDLYQIAGFLNNYPEHINSDKVTFLAFCDFNEAKKHVEVMINNTNFNKGA